MFYNPPLTGRVRLKEATQKATAAVTAAEADDASVTSGAEMPVEFDGGSGPAAEHGTRSPPLPIVVVDKNKVSDKKKKKKG